MTPGNNNNGISRREFLKTTALSGMAIGSTVLNGNSSFNRNGSFFKGAGEARNIIFMVSDGMSAGTLNMADLLKYRKFGSRSHWMNLYDSDRSFHRGLMDMASLNSPVTDSAAASSSWGSGHRINNGAINTGPDGQQYTPINQLFKDAGKRTGLVTTTRVTHATPAGFSVCIEDRNDEDEIASKYLHREYDLIMGGGARHFKAESRKDSKDLIAAFKQKNYKVLENGDELSSLRQSQDDKMLGLFYDDHLPYSIDRESIDKQIPNLSRMTEAALKQLDNREGEGFLLQIEGGRVDHGAHDNDATAMLYDQIEFDNAVKTALDFIDGRDDTLLIITTDHGNGNPALNGAGHRYKSTNDHFEKMQHVQRSNTWILSELNAGSSVSKIRERVEYGAGFAISREEANAVKRALNGKMETLYNIQNSPTAVLGSIFANYTSINFTSGNHTSDYIELAAVGPGIRNLDYFTRNTELFDLMIRVTGVNENLALV